MNIRRIISFLFCCVCILIYIIVGICCAHADICPQCLDNTPVYGFVLPVFDVAGVKLFEAYGKSATPSADGSCFVKDSKLVFFILQFIKILTMQLEILHCTFLEKTSLQKAIPGNFLEIRKK